MEPPMLDNSQHVSGLTVSGHGRLNVGHQYSNYYYADNSQASSESIVKRREDAILSSLAFPEIDSRLASVEDSCKGTFDWIFDEEILSYENTWQSRSVPNHFSQWLTDQGGLFLITGKAGSGKSTLMRHIARHQRTSRFLETWASKSGHTIIHASFFFWSNGSDLQRSHEGLWRSILFQVLKHNRSLLSLVAPGRSALEGLSLAHLERQPWARRDLKLALKQLMSCLEQQKRCLCLFIDGLDEYTGDEFLLIEDLEDLISSPFVKICASSRPRNAFEQAFAAEQQPWKLTLHHYTKGDVAQMARERFQKRSERVLSLVPNDGVTDRLVTTISNRAEGVFLWAVLVVQELRREMDPSASTAELEDILKELPTDLGGSSGLFQLILDRVKPTHKTHVARLLLLMLLDDYSVRWEVLHFLYKTGHNSRFYSDECLGLREKYRQTWDQRQHEGDQRPECEQGDEDPICSDLFDVCHKTPSHTGNAFCRVRRVAMVEDTKLQVRKWCPDLIDVSDEHAPKFVHRSVAQFLRTPEMQQRLMAQAGASFDPKFCVLALLFAYSRIKPFWREDCHELHAFIFSVEGLDSAYKPELHQMLDQFEVVQSKIRYSRKAGNRLHRDSPVLDCFWARQYLINPHTEHLVDDMGLSWIEQSGAWFFAVAASSNGPLVSYAQNFWAATPQHQRQSVGSICIAGLLCSGWPPFRPSETQVLMWKTLLASGVTLHVPYTWKKDFDEIRGRPLGTPVLLNLTLWEAFLKVARHMWYFSNDGDDVVRALEVLAIILDANHSRSMARLPNGCASLFGAMKPHWDHESDYRNPQEELWQKNAQGLLQLLQDRGLLTKQDLEDDDVPEYLRNWFIFQWQSSSIADR